MNAKEDYTEIYSKIKYSRSLRWTIDAGEGDDMENKAMTSYRMATVKNPMTFHQFIDCLEAAQNGLAYATRNHWFFIVNGNELQFTKEECARFARYFSEGFHMNLAGYSKIIKAGGCYINPRLFEDDEVFPLYEKATAYKRFIIGDSDYSLPQLWVSSQNVTVAKIKADAIADEFYAHYQTEQSDLRAEIEMQRYGL